PLTNSTGDSVHTLVEFDLSTVGGINMDNVASWGIFDAAGTYVQGRDFYVQRDIQNYTDEILSTGRGANTGTTSTLNTAGGPGIPNKTLRLRIISATTAVGAVTFNARLAYREYLNLELNAAFSSELKLEIQRVEIRTQIHKMKVA